MQNIFLHLTVTGMFRAKWMAEIHREWMDALLLKVPHRNRGAFERTHSLMDAKVRDCLLTGYEANILQLDLPNPNDQHLLAAAIVGSYDMIVT